MRHLAWAEGSIITGNDGRKYAERPAGPEFAGSQYLWGKDHEWTHLHLPMKMESR